MNVVEAVDSVNQPVRLALDATSVTVVAATLMGYLPKIATLLSVVWLLLQIYSFFEKRHAKKVNRKRRAED